jgi:[acyl-carrier-protein] S-malonyltransferase
MPPVAYFAGHSLGEYSALVSAGALDFADAVVTVRERGRLMQEAVPQGEGKMAAVIGLSAEKIAAINREVAASHSSVLDIANFNHPEQIVVSGAAAAVDAAMPRYTEAGAQRVVELPVSAPFHSSLMLPAADKLRPRLRMLNFRPCSVPVIANLTVQPYPQDPLQAPMLLHAQIFNPVRWTETIQYFEAQGVTHMLEVGPGKVLRGLAAKTTKNISAMNLDAESELPAVKEWLSGVPR